MAAIPYSANGGQTRSPQRSTDGRRGAKGTRPNHLRLVEAPLFVEPIFDELTTEALLGAVPEVRWSEPEVQLPRHQIIPEFDSTSLTTSAIFSTLVLPMPRVTQTVVPAAPTIVGASVDVASAPTTTKASSALRYRIRRLVVGMVLGAALYGAIAGASALAGAHQGAPVQIADSVRVPGGYAYTVRPGDTLWSIASRVYPNGDPRPLAAQLGAELKGKSLQPGQRLLLP